MSSRSTVMTMSPRRRLTLALLTFALLPAAVRAQVPQLPTPPPDPAQQPAPGPVEEPELIFEREVFAYPTFARRNPFAPLAVGDLRFEQLTLTGIIYSPDPSASVAVLTTGTVTVADDGTVSASEGDAYNAKVGQRIGNTIIREIQRDRVIVDVEEFGLTERRTMLFVSRRPGGSR
jgi:hypothetical protein